MSKEKSQPILHFTHCNGFPGSCYRSFLKMLVPEYQVGYIDMLGHDPNFPVTDNWVYLVEELLVFIENQYTSPVIGVGHSFGGVLSYMASLRRPDLFKAVILLDAPLLARWKCFVLSLAKRLNLVDHITPAGQVKNRRSFWQSRDEARRYLQDKPLFSRFTPESFRDFLLYGLRQTTNGVALRYNRDIEYQIFRTIPHISGNFRSNLAVPSGLLYGLESDLLRPSDLQFVKKAFGMKVEPTKGGHMFPFEFPAETAENVKNLINHLLISHPESQSVS